MAQIIPIWLNNELMQRVLKNFEKDQSIRVVKLSPQIATGKGDNYTSDILRVNVELVRTKNGKDVEEHQSIIVKVCHNSSDIHKELLDNFGVVDIEMKMMSSTLVEMERLLGGIKLGGKFIYGQEDPPFMMIEDLAPLGFRMADRLVGLDLQHSLIAVKNLAKFHASSVAVCEKNPNVKKMYEKGIFFKGDTGEHLGKFCVSAMTTFALAVETWPELGKYYSDKLMKMSDGIYDQLTDCSALDESQFNVINHGDCWVNNMLFRYDENNQPTGHIFVDFQLCVYKSPAVDLNYFLNASLAEEVLANNLDEILQEYLKMLTLTMQKIGCKTKPPSMSDLIKTLRKHELYGLFAACVCLPIMTVDKKDVKTIDEMMNDDGTIDNKGVTNPQFLKRASRRLPIWDKMGLLDVY